MLPRGIIHHKKIIMCIAIAYQQQQTSVTHYFSHLNASLPVCLKNNSGLQRVTWGRREVETGNLPEGGGVFLEDIHQGRWDEFFPQPVKLPLKRFAMITERQRVVWFELLSEHLIQGVIMRFNSEVRCYCVYLKTYQPNHPFSFWPRILYRGEQLAFKGI